MARGLTYKQKYNRMRSAMDRVQKQLTASGIPSVYQDWRVKGFHGDCTLEFWYSFGNMSNGETVGIPRAMVYTGLDSKTGTLIYASKLANDVWNALDCAILAIKGQESPNQNEVK